MKRSPSFLKEVVATEFPYHQNIGGQTVAQVNECVSLPITEVELREICSRIGDNWAPCLDGILSGVLKLAVKTKIELFTNIFETCLIEGIFSARWKKLDKVGVPYQT